MTYAESPEAAFFRKYALGRKLGEGSFGQVRAAASDSGSKFAVKVQRLPEGSARSSRRNWDLYREESKLWQRAAGHPNVVDIFEAFEARESGTHYIVMEICKCPLLDGLHGCPDVMASLSRALREMLLGLAHVHAARVVHRDVKPDNFLFGGPDRRTTKLCDFGLAVELPESGRLHGVAGSPAYMSPELLGTSGYDEKTDVWSLGVTAYLIFFGKLPYMPTKRSSTEMKALIRKGEQHPSYKESPSALEVPADAVDFVRRLLERNPEKRCSMCQALESRFVQPPAPSSAEVSAADAAVSPQSSAGHVTLRLARGVTGELKTRPDPTVQRDLDELLLRLQVQYDGGVASSAVLSRSFTGPALALHLKEPPSRQELALLGAQRSRRRCMQNCRSPTHRGGKLRLASDIKYVVSI